MKLKRYFKFYKIAKNFKNQLNLKYLTKINLQKNV